MIFEDTAPGPNCRHATQQLRTRSHPSHQAQQQQARTCPDRNSKDDISKCDDQNYVSDQVKRQSDNPEKVDKTDTKQRGLPNVLSWPDSLDGHLSQLDELCLSPQSSIRSKVEVDEKNAEPKLRSPMGDRQPLSWPQSITSFGKTNNARKFFF